MLFDEHWRGAAPVEKRSRGYTAAITAALLDAAAGTSAVDASATAALEAAAGAYSRAFQVADVQPATMATAALTPAVLGEMARSLIRSDESVWLIGVADGGVTLAPSGTLRHGRIGAGKLALPDHYLRAERQHLMARARGLA